MSINVQPLFLVVTSHDRSLRSTNGGEVSLLNRLHILQGTLGRRLSRFENSKSFDPFETVAGFYSTSTH